MCGISESMEYLTLRGFGGGDWRSCSLPISAPKVRPSTAGGTLSFQYCGRRDIFDIGFQTSHPISLFVTLRLWPHYLKIYSLKLALLNIARGARVCHSAGGALFPGQQLKEQRISPSFLHHKFSTALRGLSTLLLKHSSVVS